MTDLALYKKQVTEAIMLSITESEVSGLEKYIYGFADADGWNKSKSGTTFGRSQYDMNTNFNTARTILRKVGLSDSEIIALRDQSISLERIRGLEAKLKTPEGRAAIDEADFEHFSELYSYVIKFITAANVTNITLTGFVAIADFQNQIGSSIGGTLFGWIKENAKNNVVIDHSTVLMLKNGTAWGKKRPDDVIRRSTNVDKMCSSVAIKIQFAMMEVLRIENYNLQQALNRVTQENVTLRNSPTITPPVSTKQETQITEHSSLIASISKMFSAK
jgi:hypothetical protein